MRTQRAEVGARQRAGGVLPGLDLAARRAAPGGRRCGPGTAPRATSSDQRATSRPTTVDDPARPSKPSTIRPRPTRVGIWSKTSISWSESCRPRATPKHDDVEQPDADDAVRHPAHALEAPGEHLGERRADGEPEHDDDLGASRRAPGPTANAVTPSSAQACSSQAMLSGASSSAPRWSVVGLIGWIDGRVAGDQLAAAARGRRRDEREHDEAGQRRRQHEQEVEGAAAGRRRRARRPARPRSRR